MTKVLYLENFKRKRFVKDLTRMLARLSEERRHLVYAYLHHLKEELEQENLGQRKKTLNADPYDVSRRQITG